MNNIKIILIIHLLWAAFKIVSSKYQSSSNEIYLTEKVLIKFEHEKSDSYSNMLLKDDFLYLSGTNYVFKLNSSNISHKNFKERSIYPTIEQDFNLTIRHESKNYVKFLGSRSFLNDLIICGTNLGKPHLYDLKETDLSNQLEYNGNRLCPGVFNYTNLGLISFDSTYLKHQRVKKGIMYSAIWQEANDQFSRYGIYRKEIEFNRNFIKTYSSPYWLWSPHFISIIEDSEFIYYFFNEYSIEEFKENYELKNSSNFDEFTLNEKNLSRFSRVARVCKSDKAVKSKKHMFLNNVWTSFRKIKLECNCNQNSSVFNNLLFIKALDLHSNKIIGVFYNQLDHNTGQSVICEFDLKNLRNRLKTKQFWANSHQTDILKCDQDIRNPSENEADSDYFNQDSVENNLDDFYLFLTENTILNNKFIGECKINVPYRITAFATDNNSIYLSTSKNSIVQVNVINDRYEIGFSLSLEKINSIENVNELLINQKLNLLYFSTVDAVYQIDLKQIKELSCNKNAYCWECLAEKCHWNQEEKCVYKYDMNRNSIIDQCSLIYENNLVLNENETVVLTCGNFTISSIDRINWFKDNFEISIYKSLTHFITNKGDLILTNVNKKIYSGIYACKIDNMIDYRKYNLKVVSIPNNNVICNNSLILKETINEDLENNKMDDKPIEMLLKAFEDWKKEHTNFKIKLNDLQNLLDKNYC